MNAENQEIDPLVTPFIFKNSFIKSPFTGFSVMMVNDGAS